MDDRSDRDSRPSPDALLAQAAQDTRGRLKVFLGAAPGVGKTYEMLASAQAKVRDGMDIVVGVVETHGRRETEALLNREDWKSGRREQVLAHTPLNRIPKPSDVVPPVIFLASDDSRHITGAFLLCDGGHSMVGA